MPQLLFSTPQPPFQADLAPELAAPPGCFEETSGEL